MRFPRFITRAPREGFTDEQWPPVNLWQRWRRWWYWGDRLGALSFFILFFIGGSTYGLARGSWLAGLKTGGVIVAILLALTALTQLLPEKDYEKKLERIIRKSRPGSMGKRKPPRFR